MESSDELTARLNDLTDLCTSLEQQVQQISDTCKIILQHQAQNDARLGDVIRVRQWWKREPPIPPDYRDLANRLTAMEDKLRRLKEILT